jgi:isoleucyl-tRNA synthetase
MVEEGTGEVKGDVEGFTLSVSKAEGEKCERCWKFTRNIGSNPAHPTLCASCAKTMELL